VDHPHRRFPRPIYESLPWIYLGVGLAALVTSYALDGMPALSFIAGGVGFFGVLGGVVILLRRRDYREMRQRYPQDAD
jgi:hypothetical protein